MMGHLNSFSASGGGNLNKNFAKNSNARGLPGGGMLKLRFDWYITIAYVFLTETLGTKCVLYSTANPLETVTTDLRVYGLRRVLSFVPVRRHGRRHAVLFCSVRLSSTVCFGSRNLFRGKAASCISA